MTNFDPIWPTGSPLIDTSNRYLFFVFYRRSRICWNLGDLKFNECVGVNFDQRRQSAGGYVTLGLSTVSKVQPLFKSVTGLNPVFQPILTVTIITVNMGWNTGFSRLADLNKGCSLLTMLKLIVWRGVCSSVRLDTNILIGTSVLNCQSLKSLFSKFY